MNWVATQVFYLRPRVGNPLRPDQFFFYGLGLPRTAADRDAAASGNPRLAPPRRNRGRRTHRRRRTATRGARPHRRNRAPTRGRSAPAADRRRARRLSARIRPVLAG